MAKIRINGDTSGYIEISAPAVAGSTSITLPATTGGSLLATDASGNLNVDSGTFYVDGTNNRVGIGTTSPGSALTVRGGAGIIRAEYLTNTAQYTTLNYDGIQVNGTQDAYWVVGSSQAHIWYTGATERARIDSSGRFGIGTTSPTALFQVQGTGVLGTTYQQYISDGSRTLRLGVNSSSGEIQTTGAVPLYINYGGNDVSLFASAAGRLLVGTSTALSNFKYGGSGDFATSVQVDASSSSYDTGLALVNHHTSGVQPILRLAKSRGTAASPTIVSDGDYTGSIQFMGYDGARYIDTARIDSYVEGTPGSSDMPGSLRFLTTADGGSVVTERMRLASNGDLLCPGVYSNTTAAAANVVVSTSPYYILRSTSSIKYKTNVEDIDPAYSAKLLDCRPVWFRSTCSIDNPNWSHWGFIAEEVASIDPRLVHWKTKDRITQEDGTQIEIELETPEPEGVQYDRFVPHLLNLIKRQQQAIEDLQAEVAALKAQ